MSTTLAVGPIRNDGDLEAALARMDEIFHAEPGTREGDEAEVLAVLIEDYERRRFNLDAAVDPVATLRFVMEQRGLKQKDLVPFFGSNSRVSDVLRGVRKLTVEMISNLHRGLGIPLEMLMPITEDPASEGHAFLD